MAPAYCTESHYSAAMPLSVSGAARGAGRAFPAAPAHCRGLPLAGGRNSGEFTELRERRQYIPLDDLLYVLTLLAWCAELNQVLNRIASLLDEAQRIRSLSFAGNHVQAHGLRRFFS